MSSSPHDTSAAHPVVDLVVRLRARLDDLASPASRPVWALDTSEQRHVLTELATAQAQLEALRLRVLAEADRSGATTAHADRSAADWVAVETRQRRAAARSDLRLASALERHHVLATALARGDANADQARAVVAALDHLPAGGDLAVSPEQRCRAERWLVEQAAHHDAQALRMLGRRLFEVICPERADEIEGRLLEAEEQEAARRTSLTMREDDLGVCHGRFRIPARHGQMLTKMILALTPPPSSAPDAEAQPLPVRHGVALTELIERIPAESLPTAGGCGATVVVTMTMEQLLADLDAAGVATLDTGGRVSAAEARRLASRAGIVPVVLGGASVPLDAGRQRRFFSAQQRIALQLRDRHCTAHGCDAPPALCHAHHDRPWSQVGTTDLAHGRLLCGHHHRRVHDPSYRHERLPDGSLRFHRRE
ncbi:protein of unknown function [Nocardioides scoriae]|uniref:HNH nuclease domain-containing protein n=1 Tax=Nocardioides scoriae TaxID=642780 RepID=A0A1H1PXY9_9ACTN|nr:HNH endonuclease signature motif containing protein [Nocardioides scoriae]SDS16048.1 protein of unknown function [Nocardioides scoriae]